MSGSPVYSYLGRTNSSAGGGLSGMPNALLPNGGGAASYARRGGDTTRRKHTLRQCQKEALIGMIKSAVPLNSDACSVEQGGAQEGQAAGAPVIWRLLIFDDWGRDIIAPLLKVADLRELGVTLYMHIKTEREPVPGAPAIYFCAPTPENVERIAADCARQLYEWVYLNFTAQVPRELLELLARRLAAAPLGSIQHLRVHDRLLSYVALEEDLFSLLLPRVFLGLHRRGASEAGVEAELRGVAGGLLHVLLALGAVPVLAHARTPAAEAVARRLAGALRDAGRGAPLFSPASRGRPVVVLVDRATELATALHHPFSYRGLLAEAAGLRLNTCLLPGDGAVFELDGARDGFYAAHGGADFAEIGAAVEAALREYQAAYAALAADEGGAAPSMSRLLASAPLLAERKRALDAHTQLAYGLLTRIRADGLDRLHGVERGLLARGRLDREEFARLLRARAGRREDRQRLFLIAHLLCGPPSPDEAVVQHHRGLLADGEKEGAEGADFPALAYVKHLRSWSAAGGPGREGEAAAFGWGFAQQLAKNLVETLGGGARTALPLTRLVEALLQEPAAPDGGGGRDAALAQAERAKLLESVAGFDPQQQRRVDLRELGFSQAIVFVLGGGCFAEYDDLKRWEAERPGKAVTYGCTAILSGDEMLQELSILGEELR